MNPDIGKAQQALHRLAGIKLEGYLFEAFITSFYRNKFGPFLEKRAKEMYFLKYPRRKKFPGLTKLQETDPDIYLTIGEVHESMVVSDFNVRLRQYDALFEIVHNATITTTEEEQEIFSVSEAVYTTQGGMSAGYAKTHAEANEFLLRQANIEGLESRVEQVLDQYGNATYVVMANVPSWALDNIFANTNDVDLALLFKFIWQKGKHPNVIFPLADADEVMFACDNRRADDAEFVKLYYERFKHNAPLEV